MKKITHNNLDSISDMIAVTNILREYGVCVVPNYPNADKLHVQSLKAIEDEGTEYEFGINVSMDQRYKNYSDINLYFNNTTFYSITKEYLDENFSFNSSVFITKDFKVGEQLARNGFLHFDRYHKFKFMVYLSDVDESCGPFSIVPGSHKLGKELREKEWENLTDYDGLKNRIELDHPDIYDENKIIPIIGKFGTLIIFDTDVFHMGGKTSGGKRLIIRSHTDINGTT